MFEKFARLSAGIIIGVMLLGLILVFIPKEASAQYEYGVSVEVSGEGSKTVDVRPGKPGTSSFEFIVTNTGELNAWEKVELTASSSTGRQTAASPPILILKKGESKKVMVFITANRNEIAPFITYYELHAEVTDGSSGPPKFPVEGRAMVTLMLEQYSYFMFDAENPYEKIGPGKESVLSFNVKNIGNGQDDIKFDIVNLEDLEDEGWTIVRPDDLIIQPGKKETVQLSIRTPKGAWKDEVQTIQIIAKSSIDPKYSKQTSITLWVRGTYIPGFEPMFTIFAIGLIAAIAKKKYC